MPPKPAAGPVGNGKGSDQVKILNGTIGGTRPFKGLTRKRVKDYYQKNAASGIGSIKIPHRKLGSRRGNIGSIEIPFRRVDDVGSTIYIDDPPPGYIPELYKDQRSKIRVVNPYKAQLEKIRILNGGKTDKFLAAAAAFRAIEDKRMTQGERYLVEVMVRLAEAPWRQRSPGRAGGLVHPALPGRLQTAVRRVLGDVQRAGLRRGPGVWTKRLRAKKKKRKA